MVQFIARITSLRVRKNPSAPGQPLGCPFCQPAAVALIREWPLVLALLDRFPVSPGHVLLITRRHVTTWFDASLEEQRALLDGIQPVCRHVESMLQRHADGWNVGFNAGRAAGQTISHLHVHVIPRWHGDVADPRGGVRGVIPARQAYPWEGIQE